MSISIHGYAIISADDRISDASGRTPPALMNEADWAYFQAGLDEADVVVLGRLGHEANPNRKGRQRVVVSGSVAVGLEARDDAMWWNPGRVSWRQASGRLLPRGGRVAVPGGQGVFDLFLGIGYDVFHLSRADKVSIGEGRAVFSACGPGRSAHDLLAAHGLHADAPLLIDPVDQVTLTLYRSRLAAG